MPSMASSTVELAPAVNSPRLRLLARVIFGLTILGIAGGIWFSIIDAGKVETDLATARARHVHCTFHVAEILRGEFKRDVVGTAQSSVINDRTTH